MAAQALTMLCRCYVNPMTCQHKPFLANNGQLTQAWDTCMAPGMNTTIDAGGDLCCMDACSGLMQAAS